MLGGFLALLSAATFALNNACVRRGVLSGSVDPEASAVTGSGAVPELGVRLRAATGGASATVTVADLLAERPPESVTVTVMG